MENPSEYNVVKITDILYFVEDLNKHIGYYVNLQDADGYGTCSCPSFLSKYDPDLPVLPQIAIAENNKGWECKHLKICKRVINTKPLNFKPLKPFSTTLIKCLLQQL